MLSGKNVLDEELCLALSMASGWLFKSKGGHAMGQDNDRRTNEALGSSVDRRRRKASRDANEAYRKSGSSPPSPWFTLPCGIRVRHVPIPEEA